MAHKTWVVREDGAVEVVYVPSDLFPPMISCAECGLPEDCVCDVEIPDDYDHDKPCRWLR